MLIPEHPGHQDPRIGKRMRVSQNIDRARTGELVRHGIQYFAYQAGARRTVHRVGNQSAPSRITILIPESLGDIAINSSVTAYYKAHYPGVHITLITHQEYAPAGYFNADYDEVVAYGPPFQAIDPGRLSYKDEMRICRGLTPEMDLLLLPQPSAWCDALSARYPMLELQNRLCGVPADVRLPPRLRLPPGALEGARRLRTAPGPALFMARQAYTLRFGSLADEYCRRIVEWCIAAGIRVFWNSSTPLICHDFCVAVGTVPLAVAVALATLCDAVISMRSGFSDLVAMCARGQPHLVFYPPTRYPYSRLSWLDWCSLRAMGIHSVIERANAFNASSELIDETSSTQAWLRDIHGLRSHAPENPGC